METYLDIIPHDLKNLIYSFLDYFDVLAIQDTDVEWNKVYYMRYPGIYAIKNNSIGTDKKLYLNAVATMDTSQLKEFSDANVEIKYDPDFHRGIPIKRIPPSELIQVKRLYLNWYNLIHVPFDIYNLKNLKWLGLRHNLISDISSSISNLENLRELYLDYNNISIFPKEILQLKNLKVLSLNDNKLSSIPDDIIELQNLKELRVFNNPIVNVNVPDFFNYMLSMMPKFRSLAMKSS